MNRFCSSGLQTIALAAQRIVAGEEGVYVAGGVECTSTVHPNRNQHMLRDAWTVEHKPELYLTMIETAEIVARRYGIGRERMDEYGVRSQVCACAADAAGHFKQEIVATPATMAIVDHDGHFATRDVVVERDEGLRADTTLDGVSKIRPATPGGLVAAGNASQFSDGAGACVVMSAKEAARRNVTPLGIFRGFAVSGCEPDEMGIGPVFAVPKLLKRAGLEIDDIGLWELNEAFAVQVLYCRDRLGIPDEQLCVCHNGWEPKRMEPRLSKEEARTKLGLPLDRRLVVYTGRMNHKKGLDVALEMARRLPEHLFVLVGSTGDGPVEREAKDIPNVKIVEWQKFSGTAAYLYAADVVLVPPSLSPLLEPPATLV